MSITLERTRPETCLSDLALDGLIAGALEADRAGAARAHLEECASCRTRLQGIEAGRDQAGAILPPLVLPPQAGVGVPGAPVISLASRWRVPIITALAAAIAMFAIFIPRGDVTRTKGGASLGFYVRHGDQVRRGADGEIVNPQDALRFYYSIDRPAHLAIISRDAAGKTSVYYPAPGAPAKAQPAGREIVLENAVLLDDTLGREEIRGIFCDAPVEADRLTVGPIPDTCTVVQVGIEKRP